MEFSGIKKRRLSIRNKILYGFLSLFLILLLTIGLTLGELSNTNKFAANLSQKDLPTYNATQLLATNIQKSFASLRGWMLTGDTSNIAMRKSSWVEINANRQIIDEHASRWDNPRLSAIWIEIKPLLSKLEQVQANIESIANSDQENLALTILTQEGVKKYSKLYNSITQLINIEKTQPATPARKKLLAAMADFRGKLAKAVGDMRLFVMSGAKDLIQKISASQEGVKIAEGEIVELSSDLTPDQKIIFNEMKPVLNSFIEVMNKVNLVRSQKNWNKANFTLQKEAMPIAEKIQQLIGNGKADATPAMSNILHRSYNDNMKDLTEDLNILAVTQWTLLGLGIILSSLIIWITSRSIVKPINYAIEIAKSIANGGRDLKIQIKGSDETADLLIALRYMDNSIYEAEAGIKKSELQVKELFEDLQTRIKKYRDYIELVSQGDLTQRLDISGTDDLAQLGEHLNAMTDGLTMITSQIVSASNDISSGLKQLEGSATSQAASASEQAASVTEVTSVVEEIKSTTKQTLEKATGLGESAERTSAEGRKGKESIDSMIDSMRNLQVKIEQVADTVLGLSEKSQQIGEITDAVSDIAKQSKMLALNASIEAAKAGEAGKGFAVVAGEVKELAEKSQASTENVKVILQDIRQATESAVMAIEEGTKGVNNTLNLAKETGGIINSLGGVINESSVSSKQIGSAVRQESIGIDQVVKSIGEIDKVTRQFSVATDQTKQASLSLSKVANALIKTVSIYKLSKKDRK